MNIIKGIGYNEQASYYLINAGSLVIFLIIAVLFESTIIEIIILCAVGALSTAYSQEVGNTTGVSYFLFAWALSKNRDFIYYICGFTIISLVAKYMIIEEPVTRSFNDLIGYGFNYLVGYVIYKRIFNEQSR